MLLDHEVFKNEGATPGPAKAHEWRDSSSTPTSVLDAMQELEAMQEGRAQIDADWAAAALPSPTVPPAAAEPLTPAPAPLPPTPLPVPPPPTNVAELRVTPCAELPLVSTVEGFATAAECESLIAAAYEVLASYDREPQPRERIPVAASSEARRLHARLHARLLSLIEAWPGDELRWATDLFGQGAGLSEMTFRYSAGEPAINIYTVGGEFAPHTDEEHLTMLMPLSGGFEGGGTAFWGATSHLRPDLGVDGLSTEERMRAHADRTNWLPPQHVLKPPAGTAILFGGDVTHAGLPVLEGTRHLFVMSFSLKPAWRPRVIYVHEEDEEDEED